VKSGKKYAIIIKGDFHISSQVIENLFHTKNFVVLRGEKSREWLLF
jgi:hypothetical protein